MFLYHRLAISQPTSEKLPFVGDSDESGDPQLVYKQRIRDCQVLNS